MTRFFLQNIFNSMPYECAHCPKPLTHICKDSCKLCYLFCMAAAKESSLICILKLIDEYAISATEQTSAVKYLPITENVFSN